MTPEITFCMTSCGRFHLLERTMDSFMKYVDYPIKEFIIVDDSTDKKTHDSIKSKYPFVDLIVNEERLGQIKSIDLMYLKVNTDFIFHCEDDWEFMKTGFIDKSLKILNEIPDVFQCWIRIVNDHAHPLLDTAYHLENFDYKELLPFWDGLYSGFTFNPSLIRKRDYDRLGGYYPHGGETKIGHVLKNQYNFRFMSLLDGYCKHIGQADHVDDVDVNKNKAHYYTFNIPT